MTLDFKTGTAELQILVVDEDITTLHTICVLLTSEGHTVSAFSRATGLNRVIEELRPDVVLVDVLMPDLNRRSLTELLARCHKRASPIVILHSRLSERMLRTVVPTGDAAGIIQKTASKLEFLLAFNTIVDRLAPESRQASSLHGVVSGTHRIGSSGGADVTEEEDTFRTGSRR